MNDRNFYLSNLAGCFVCIFAAINFCSATANAAEPTDQPNILWVITDDHRADSIRAFNEATIGQGDSKLGHVSSPSADQLAKRGVLFTRAYCNSPGCAPSRTSMHFGMYPHRCGQYGFESGHQSMDFCKPMFPTLMAEAGYRTAHFGKSGFASFDWAEPKLKKTSPYQVKVDQKELYKNEAVDWFHRKTFTKGKGATGDIAFWAMPDSGIYIHTPKEGPQSLEDQAKRKRVDEELDLLYSVGKTSNSVVGGVSPQPTATTQDGYIASSFIDYVQNAGKPYKTPWERRLDGAPTDQPLFANVGFHFPHTPVLPSKEFRDQFAGQTYNIPEFSKDELKKLPPQLVTWFKKSNFADLDAGGKQQAIRDYFAFCAMGDSLVGKAVNEFKSYSESQGREYVIVYVIGDHGWHLGEQGGENKFAPYDTSNRCAVIAISSDGKRYPAGKVCHDPIEFVDFAPTFLSLAGADLAEEKFAHLDGRPIDDTLSGEFKRDYVLGNINHVIGPRAYLRSNDFAFSMRTREKNGIFGTKWGHAPGEDVKWGLEAPRDDVELALFDLRNDPNEQSNVANDEAYIKLADWFREKLGRIVLGDGRVEADWTTKNNFAVSDFATGAHDGKLNIPAGIIPNVKDNRAKTKQHNTSLDQTESTNQHQSSALSRDSSLNLPTAPDGYRWAKNEALTDEFDGTQLDSGKWHNHNPKWAGRPPGKLVPSAVSVKNGHLRIQCTPLKPVDGKFSIACGTIQSKAKALYGYHECRMKASKLSTSSNFWFVGDHVKTLQGTQGGELIVQLTIGNSQQHNQFMKSNVMVSMKRNGKDTKREKAKATDRIKLGSGVADEFHIYGCWWVDASKLKFYVDGEYAYTINPSTKFGEAPFRNPLSMNLICETFNWQPVPTEAELTDDTKNTALFDYVRSYRLVKRNEKFTDVGSATAPDLKIELGPVSKGRR